MSGGLVGAHMGGLSRGQTHRKSNMNYYENKKELILHTSSPQDNKKLRVIIYFYISLNI